MHKIIFDLNKIRSKFFGQVLVRSPYFKNFIHTFWEERANSDIPYSNYFLEYSPDEFIDFLLHILNKKPETITWLSQLEERKKNLLLSFIDSLYDYWRTYERYLILVNEEGDEISHRMFLKQFSSFSHSIVDSYRDIYETILGKEQTVYRILPSGGNAGVLLSKRNITLPKTVEYLKDVPVVDSVVTQPPFIIKTKQKTRKGFFFEKNEHVTIDEFKPENLYACCIDVYNTKGIVYFDKEYMGFLIALGNLFHVSSFDSKKHDKFDFVVLFGTENDSKECYYYKDEDCYVAVCPKKADIDYFGYCKKIVLTLFNLVMINRNLLPIHGAGIKIRKGNKIKNFVILGDSGAGKSETIEAIKLLYGQEYQIDTIFDDMGTFHIDDGKVSCTGTEIGAFVRLDDLDQGYSLRSADRAVFLNIDEANSRVVIPLGDFEITLTHHHVDAFLLADNFTDDDKGLIFYDNPESALQDFIKGERVAMQTTSEKGLVSTYFANPFGPLQEKDKVDSYIKKYFDKLFENNIPVGRLYTRLSLDRKTGPHNGARKLIELFNSMD